MSSGVFSSAPVLPVVIPPYPGESLAGWLRALADFYGLRLAAYLNRLGTPLVHSKGTNRYETANRRLTVFPEPELLLALQVDTGINMARLRAMTFIGIEEQLRRRCLKHDWVCIECRNAASKRASRFIDLRDQRAAWLVFCPDHPLPVTSRDIRSRFPVELFCGLVRKMHLALERAAFDSASWSRMFGPEPGPCPVASFLAAADFFNDFLVLEIIGFDEAAGRVSFAVMQGLQRSQWERDGKILFRHHNAPIIPLVFAWQILQDPSMPVYYASARTGRYDLLDEPRANALKRLLREARELLSGPSYTVV
jgi:hypothetical protein